MLDVFGVEDSADSFDLLEAPSEREGTVLDALTDRAEPTHEERLFPCFDTFWHGLVE